MNKPVSDLAIVVPCYNEEDVLPETIKRLSQEIDSLIEEGLISNNSKIIFVDDGSRDGTWNIILNEGKTNNNVKGLKLAKNAGHQNALLAGLLEAESRFDCVISIDADLQDDLGVIREFIIQFHKGNDVVYGVRNSRKKDSYFKRTTAQQFYKIMRKMGVNLVYNHADYRLMSRRVLEHLREFNEVNLFLRGIIPLIGFESTNVYYERHERYAGESKYPLKKMLAFAFDGITSFSVTPIRLITTLGFSMFIISFIMLVYVLYQRVFGYTVSGWPSLMISIWFIGGIQLIALGLIGEYIGKIYKEVKRRPRYIVEEEI